MVVVVMILMLVSAVQMSVGDGGGVGVGGVGDGSVWWWWRLVEVVVLLLLVVVGEEVVRGCLAFVVVMLVVRGFEDARVDVGGGLLVTLVVLLVGVVAQRWCWCSLWCWWHFCRWRRQGRCCYCSNSAVAATPSLLIRSQVSG